MVEAQIEWGAVFNSAPAVFVILTGLWLAMKRVVRAVENNNAVPVHTTQIEGLEKKVDALVEAVRPTNGDHLSISDRLDKLKYAFVEHTEADATNFAAIMEKLEVKP